MVYSYLVLPRGQDAPSTPSHLHRRSRHAKLSDVISSPRASRGGNYNASSSKVEEVPVDNEWDAAHDAATSSSLKTTCLTTATPTPAATATGAKAAANLAGTSPSTKDKDAYINAPLDTVPVDSSPQPGILSPRSQTPPTPDGKDPSPSSSSPAGTGFWRSWKGIAIMVAASSLILGLSLGLGLGLGLPNNHNRDTDTDTGNGGVIDNKRANIVFIMSDDQDKQLNSMDYQSAIQRELVAKGTQFVNHYTNTALCCPSRSTILRGQTVHNTNLTNVQLPGGSYNKWVASGQDEEYLPHWLKQAGYRNEYVGKIMNGFGTSNYKTVPKGWDHSDMLLEPYIDDFNTPVFSANGEDPVYYEGFHQTDVIRIKSLERIDALANQDKPFSLFIAPFAPHIGSIGQKAQSRPIPCKRHNQLFQDVKVPRTPNFNPPDVHQRDKGGWLRYLPKMTNKFINFADYAYRSRLQAIQSIDEIVEDVVAKLDEKGLLNNTYVIYTSDNGYHVGQHRVPAGKSLFFSEDTNLPFVVRGPNVPANVTSKIPGLHLDLAPTFLDIAGLNESKWPEFFDGRSLLPQWHEPLGNNGANSGKGNGKESINVEYWGQAAIEAPGGNTLGSPFWNTTYKTIRTLGEDESWLYTKWCNGDRELYNTAKDPYELTNLIPAGNHKKLEDRLNALLMVTKSCEQGSCREPWKLIQPPDGTTFTNLAQARDSKYDSFFANFARVSFNQCLSFQVEANEGPYFPAITDENVGLGRAYRKPTSGLQYKFGKRKITADGLYGTAAQRHATFAQLTDGSRKLTAEEINTS